jgi:hypothetical protein
VAIELEDRYGAAQVLTELELRFEEMLAGEPIASAELGDTLDGRPRLHRPDLVVKGEDGFTVYEIELTPKSRWRLEAILRAWRRAYNVERCVYLCPPSSPSQEVVVAASRDPVCGLDRDPGRRASCPAVG